MIRFVDSVVQYRSILSNALFLFYHHRVSFSISTNKALSSSILSIFKSFYPFFPDSQSGIQAWHIISVNDVTTSLLSYPNIHFVVPSNINYLTRKKFLKKKWIILDDLFHFLRWYPVSDVITKTKREKIIPVPPFSLFPSLHICKCARTIAGIGQRGTIGLQL